jgi:hypothetical protein
MVNVFTVKKSAAIAKLVEAEKLKTKRCENYYGEGVK